ncbi:protein kinase family protein [Nocardia stercoris]|uniref:Phosphatidylinositol kinase n=1 Tax=Nocardia stercoris TaxID=2483361 RepID=A0A3M2LH53_9NOCA|nr:hypothetical protein [Nocardia stercoris]RMI35315.1 hypothetical protein EBN03_03265 [Nocardia stercoris]
MTDGVSPVVRNIVERVSKTLESGAQSFARTYQRSSSAARADARVLRDADSSSTGLFKEALPVRRPNPMYAPMPSRADWNYRPSPAESAMAARRLTTDVEFTGDMREAVAKSSTEVRKMRSEGGELNIYKPIDGERFDAGLPFFHTPGALTSRELGTYRVDESLEFGRVPTTARTEGVIGPDGQPSGPGMIQQFVESTPARSVDAYPVVQQQQVACLDYITGQMDRHPGNYRTVERGGHLDIVAIDHGRSFPLGRDPFDVWIDSDFVAAHKGVPLEREVLDAIHRVDVDHLRAALGDAGLHPNAIDGALARLLKIRELGCIPEDVKLMAV